MKKTITILLVLLGGFWANAQNALNFPDNNDYGIVPYDPLFEFTEDFTIEAWIKTTGGGYQTVIATDSLNSMGHTGYWFGLTPSGFAGIQLFNNSFSWSTITGTTAVNDGEWHHIAAAADGTTIYVVVDGVQEGSGAYYAPVYNGHHLDVGVDQEGNYLNGAVDDIRLWWKAVSPAEINLYKDSCINALDFDSLMIHYKFDETSGSTFADAASFSIDGTLTNMTDNDWVPGIVCVEPEEKSALQFDAVDDYVEIDTTQDNIFDFTGDFTIEAWVKPESGGSWPSVVSKFDNQLGSRYGFWFGISGSGVTGMQVFDGTGGSWPTAYGTTNIVDEQWHHIAGVMKDDTMRVYLNGVEEGVAAAFTPVFNEHAMWLGNDAENDIFKGTMDRVRIWGKARSAAELLADKDVCLNGQETDLLALYTFSEGMGSTVGNSVGNGYTGTLKNMDTVTAWVPGIECTSTSTASLESVQTSEEIKMYPNPTEGTVNIQFGAAKNAMIQVYSMDGQQVYAQNVSNAQEHTFVLDGEPGVYHVIVTSEGVSTHMKLIRL